MEVHGVDMSFPIDANAPVSPDIEDRRTHPQSFGDKLSDALGQAKAKGQQIIGEIQRQAIPTSPAPAPQSSFYNPSNDASRK